MSRTPRGVRGLKFSLEATRVSAQSKSHPSRGAWIEIEKIAAGRLPRRSRTPRGVRGLKSLNVAKELMGHSDVAPLAGCVD